MNHEEPNLANVEIPPDFLSKLHLGRCAYNYKGKCTTPGGSFTDFNVWSRALSEMEMKVFFKFKTFFTPSSNFLMLGMDNMFKNE